MLFAQTGEVHLHKSTRSCSNSAKHLVAKREAVSTDPCLEALSNFARPPRCQTAPTPFQTGAGRSQKTATTRRVQQPLHRSKYVKHATAATATSGAQRYGSLAYASKVVLLSAGVYAGRVGGVVETGFGNQPPVSITSFHFIRYRFPVTSFQFQPFPQFP